MSAPRVVPVVLAAALAASLGLVAAGRSHAAASAPAAGTVTVGGQSTLSVAPTQAQLALGTQVTAPSAQAAMAAEAARMAAIVSALERAGAPRKDIQTQAYDLSPNETNPTGSAAPRIVGYTVSDSLLVTTSQLARVGALIDAAVAAGANEVQGVTFGVGNSTALIDRADADALAQARAQAGALAAQAGEHLGPLVSLSVGQNEPPVTFTGYAASAANAPTIVPPQGVTVSAQVTAVYRLLP
jgi:uncharacterized protein YggE